MNMLGQKITAEPCTEDAWKAMCQKSQFTRSEIAKSLGVKQNIITQFTNRLLKQKAIELIGKNSNGLTQNVYRVLSSTLDEKADIKFDSLRISGKKGTVRQQIWNTLRINRKADKKLILSTTAATETGARRYLRILLDAGYIRQINKLGRREKGSCLMYRLVRDSGRLHPIEKPDGLWDQNTQTFYPFKKGTSNE